MQLDVPEREFGGYIFDCDGTIADTMPLHYRAWTRAMADFGGRFPEDLFYQWGGKPALKIVVELNALFGLCLDPAETVRHKERYFLEQIPDVRPVDAVMKIAARMRGVKPMAIASGGHHELVDATLCALGIFDWFEAVVCAGDYVCGKPDPEPFLLAAARMRVEPGDCIVFEDSPTGIEAANRAGMCHVFVPSAPERP